MSRGTPVLRICYSVQDYLEPCVSCIVLALLPRLYSTIDLLLTLKPCDFHHVTTDEREGHVEKSCYAFLIVYKNASCIMLAHGTTASGLAESLRKHALHSLELATNQLHTVTSTKLGLLINSY